MFEELLSDCCDAKPVGITETISNQTIGTCSCCNLIATFYDDELDGEDWLDEIEYIREHIDE